MPAPNSNDPGAAGGFDPNRHRKEIEQMEKRFRERSERHGGGPVSTGEIDSRVADEMKQFFDASAQQFQSVVPQLQEGEQARAMSETTGEIRKKIDDFFAQVKEAGGGESAPDTQELQQRKSKWAGMFPGQDFAKAPAQGRAPAAPAPAAAPRPAAAWTPPEPPDEEMGELPPSAAPPTMSGAKMDLRTALEKLRRSGSGRTDEPASRPVPRAAAPAAPAPRREAPPVQRPAPPAPLPAAAAAPPRREAPAPSKPAAPAPEPDAAPRREAAPTRAAMAQAAPPARAPAVTPPPAVPTRAAMTAPRSASASPAAPPVTSRREPPAPKAPAAAPADASRQFAGRQYAAPVQGGGPRAPVGGARLVSPDRTGPVIDRPPRPRMHAALTTTEINAPMGARRESPIKASRPMPSDLGAPVRAAREAPAPVAEDDSESVEAPPPASEPVAPAPASEPVPAPASDPGDSFDSIFDEVQCIVMDTLKVSVDETFQAAREAEPEISQAIAPQPAPARAPAPVPKKPRPAEKLVRASDEIARDQVRASEPPAPMGTSQAIRRTQLARPEEDEEEEQDEAPNAPYDWGVKPAAQAKGAWLLDTPDESAEPAPSPEGEAASEPDSPDPAPAGGGGGGGGGARGYLVRKASDEVRRFQPVLQALRESKMLSPEELGDRPSSKSTGGDDDVVSVDTFRDDRPRDVDLDQELSPMRLVEELRRLKRVTQALVTKGLISQEDLNKSVGD